MQTDHDGQFFLISLATCFIPVFGISQHTPFCFLASDFGPGGENIHGIARVACGWSDEERLLNPYSAPVAKLPSFEPTALRSIGFPSSFVHLGKNDLEGQWCPPSPTRRLSSCTILFTLSLFTKYGGWPLSPGFAGLENTKKRTDSSWGSERFEPVAPKGLFLWREWERVAQSYPGICVVYQVQL